MVKNLNIILTREKDEFIELAERARISVRAGARIFISIHMNAFNGSARGIETFLHTNSTASRPIANKMNEELLKQFNVPNRGVKQANFAVLRGTYKRSLSILSETLFMDNAKDAQLFNRSNFVQKTAQAHANTVLSFANDGDTVCLDPGHGGHDNGASGHGHLEKDLVLEIALKTREILEGKQEQEDNQEDEQEVKTVEYKRDEKPSEWARDAVKWAVDNDISDGTYVQRPPTRQELITMLYRYHKNVAE